MKVDGGDAGQMENVSLNVAEQDIDNMFLNCLVLATFYVANNVFNLASMTTLSFHETLHSMRVCG
jgi:hypothetical protein